MKLSQKTLNTFNENLQKYAEDKFTERTKEKVSVIKLVCAIFTQTLHDLYNGTKDQQESANNYIKDYTFDMHCEMIAIEPRVMLRMLLNIDHTLVDYDVIGDYDEQRD